MDSLITKLYKSPKSILTSQDLALIWQINDKQNLYAKTSYYVKRNVLISLSRGIFAKSTDYNKKELATSIYSPSYISFETVLRNEGLIFQHYENIFLAGPYSLTKKINESNFVFRKLKDQVLFNLSGVLSKNNYSIATIERAFLDMIYLFPNYYFDNLDPIDWKKCNNIVKIYNNKQLIKRLNTYQKKYAK